MFGLKVLEYNDAITDELKRPGPWTIAYVESSMAWPVRVQRVVYLGEEYWIIPVTSDAYPGIAVRTNQKDQNVVRERILRFLSVLSWVEGKGAVLISFGGGGAVHAYKRKSNSGLVIRDQFDLRYLPEITDPKAQLALALMREGRGIGHISYSFLSFYRVLEVAIGKPGIAQWIEHEIKHLPRGSGSEALAKLISTGVSDVAKHLYVSGRCAIAHAGSNPIIDPDKPADSSRLYQERPLIECLAEIAIENKLGVQTSMTVFKEHLYELSGFKRVLGADIVKDICAGKPVGEGQSVDIPSIDFQLVGKGPFEVLRNLQPVVVQQLGSRLALEFERPDQMLRIKFSLNFADERLEFDVHNGVFGIKDDDSSIYAEHKAQITEFMKWYFLNGCIQITDSATGELISRKDEFIPVNVMVEPAGFDKEIEYWRSIATDRRAKECA